MKKLLIFAIIIFTSIFSLTACGRSDEILRIHIRANSNSVIDQQIKMTIKDEVVEYITPLIANCKNSTEVKKLLNKNTQNIETIVDDILKNNNFEYASSVSIKNEFFPSRDYNGEVFPSDYYDALIIGLGEAKGDNWWCVAYPPLCFVGEDNASNNITYKSKLLEMINNFFGGK